MSEPYYTRSAHDESAGERSRAMEGAADTGRRAAEGAKRAASDAASSVKAEARRMLDQQVDTGAAYLGHAATSMRTAASDLSRNAPPLAGFADMLADRLDVVAESVKGKTAVEVWGSAVDFTRRQPGLVFGLASLAGFLAYRTMKNTRLPAVETQKVGEEFHGA